MAELTEEEAVKAFRLMWDNYPESVRLIDRSFRVVAGNKMYFKLGGEVGVKCNVGDPALHRGCQAMNALKSGEAKIVTSEVEGVRWDSFWVPVAGSDNYHIHFTNGMNEYIAKMTAAQR